jgi:phospholipid-transporting ATPase
VKETYSHLKKEEDLLAFKGSVMCEKPNDRIYQFFGVLSQDSTGESSTSQKVSVLTIDNVLLRGSSLRNTEAILGVVTFTGHDTKIMRNTCSSKHKKSRIEKMINVQILLVVFFQMILCGFGALYGSLWER